MKEYVIVGNYDVVGHPNQEIIFSTAKHTEILQVRDRLETIRDRARLSTSIGDTPAISREDAEFLADHTIPALNIHRVRALFVRVLSTS